MSFATRLKEQRERIGLTQVDLATALGVTKGAVGNYETGASSPKAEILYQLFDILHCDANYLFQDEMRTLRTSNATPEEMEFLVKKYRALDERGKEIVDSVLDIEYRQCAESESSSPTTMQLAEVFEMPYLLQPASAGPGQIADDEITDKIYGRQKLTTLCECLAAQWSLMYRTVILFWCVRSLLCISEKSAYLFKIVRDI